MRGYANHNFPAFDAAAAKYRAAGWKIISPAELDRELGITEATPEAAVDIRAVMRKDVLAILDDCTAVIMLPGWERSRGATAERALAIAVNMDVLYEEA